MYKKRTQISKEEKRQSFALSKSSKSNWNGTKQTISSIRNICKIQIKLSTPNIQ